MTFEIFGPTVEESLFFTRNSFKSNLFLMFFICFLKKIKIKDSVSLVIKLTLPDQRHWERALLHDRGGGFS